MPQALTGILVLDFTTLLPGPLATLMLAETGAEVIKVERPDGEDMRRIPPQFTDPVGTRSAVARIIASETAEYWHPKLASANCCANIVTSLEEAVRDPHFVERGLFAHKVAGPSGIEMPALPVPISAKLRDAFDRKPVSKIGANTDTLLGSVADKT